MISSMTSLGMSSRMLFTSRCIYQAALKTIPRTTGRLNTCHSRAFSSHGILGMAVKPAGTSSPSRDRPPRTKPGSNPESVKTNDLRRTVMEEVAIPGKFRMYFKPDKRAIRQAGL
ncbi:hypothetical protein BC939DRAFT_100405 [Gamsiella multidivaricata]|uniref:uncharacterized protein n=1 Tax=Gamsiella multidivaricata TaxID=101098 RepID=UPI00221E4FE4|nr:uncharacterized protein BC939DRAFT_100405 [Gamsiella multidivaricata]KAI7832301.1 hypothetical protein BC939DRAFT_100405 [Gamsiella multidivaricata]